MHVRYNIKPERCGGYTLIRKLINNNDFIYPVVKQDHLAFDEDNINHLIWIAKTRFGIHYLDIEIKK